VASGVVGIVVVVVVVGVCNRSQSQIRTNRPKCTCLIFGVSIGLDPERSFHRSKFKVTRDISPTVSGWLLVCYVAIQMSRVCVCLAYVLDPKKTDELIDLPVGAGSCGPKEPCIKREYRVRSGATW